MSALYFHLGSCGCSGLFRDTTSRLTATVFRNLGRLCLSCRCFCNQNMGRSTTDPKTLSSSARCHFNTARVFPFSFNLIFVSFYSLCSSTLTLRLTTRLILQIRDHWLWSYRFSNGQVETCCQAEGCSPMAVWIAGHGSEFQAVELC